MAPAASSLPPLTQSEAERLSLLRYQLSVALDQARLPAPLNALAINTLRFSHQDQPYADG